MRFLSLAYLLLLVIPQFACNLSQTDSAKEKVERSSAKEPVELSSAREPVELSGDEATALFAGGCFWCTESDFETLDGVIRVVSGYAGGDVANPSYDAVSSGTTGHREVVQVIYDPTVTSYRELVDFFWRIFNPTDDGGSFVDRGHQYTSAIYYETQEERKAAEESKRALEDSGRFAKPIVTPILPVPEFYQAEDYHQDYYTKNPLRYKFYRRSSGRDAFIERVWGKPD